MSKRSKPRDRWVQVNASSHTRPADFCAGCGYFRVVYGVHRDDCTRLRTVTRRSRKTNQLRGENACMA